MKLNNLHHQSNPSGASPKPPEELGTESANVRPKNAFSFMQTHTHVSAYTPYGAVVSCWSKICIWLIPSIVLLIVSNYMIH